MSTYEAAINLLREERRGVAEARRTLMRDEDLRQSAPAHRRQLLAQTQAEIVQLGRALDVLIALQDGDLVMANLDDRPVPLPVVGAWTPSLKPLCGKALVKRFVPVADYRPDPPVRAVAQTGDARV